MFRIFFKNYPPIRYNEVIVYNKKSQLKSWLGIRLNIQLSALYNWLYILASLPNE